MLSRSLSTFEIGGTTKVPITPSTIKKMISTTKKVPLGTRKLLVPPPSAWPAARTTALMSPIVADYFGAIGVANTNSAMKARLMK